MKMTHSIKSIINLQQHTFFQDELFALFVIMHLRKNVLDVLTFLDWLKDRLLTKSIQKGVAQISSLSKKLLKTQFILYVGLPRGVRSYLCFAVFGLLGSNVHVDFLILFLNFTSLVSFTCSYNENVPLLSLPYIKFKLLRAVDEILESLIGLKKSVWLSVLKQNLFPVTLCKGIRTAYSGILEKFACGIWNRGYYWLWNLESWALGSRIDLKESEILANDSNPETKFP